MSGFALPTNIKQIGTIGDGTRIYMEDYVNTYLRQFADSGPAERQAFLIGKQMIIDGLPYLFIKGAVQGKFSEDALFTQKSFEYADEQIKRHFGGFELVGWMRSQRGYGTQLSVKDFDFHTENFSKPETTVFVIDPEEKSNCFYVWNDDRTTLKEVKGYFIYYDKNIGMQEYMMENKVTKTPFKERAYIDEESRTPNKRRTSAAANPFNKNEPAEYRRMTNMLVSLCAVLFVICFIMGAGLIQSDGRLNKLEKNFVSLDSAYSYLLSETSRIASQAVFAQENAEGGAPTNAPVYETADNEYTPVPAETPRSPMIVPVQTQAPVVTETPYVSTENPRLEQTIIYDKYTIQNGDSLTSISRFIYGTPFMVDAIMELNGISDPNMIYYGQTLLLPKQ